MSTTNPPNAAGDAAAPVFALDEAWTYKITVLADSVARRVGSVVQEISGLSLGQWRVLAAVADKPGRTSSEVVEITPMDKPLVSRAVSHLVELNLLRREASQTDGRRSHLQLTLEGEKAYQRIVTALMDTGAWGMNTLPQAEHEQFNQLIDQALEAYR